MSGFLCGAEEEKQKVGLAAKPGLLRTVAGAPLALVKGLARGPGEGGDPGTPTAEGNASLANQWVCTTTFTLSTSCQSVFGLSTGHNHKAALPPRLGAPSVLLVVHTHLVPKLQCKLRQNWLDRGFCLLQVDFLITQAQAADAVDGGVECDLEPAAASRAPLLQRGSSLTTAAGGHEALGQHPQGGGSVGLPCDGHHEQGRPAS